MSKITLGGKPTNTNGELPAVGSAAPDFILTNAADMSEVSLKNYAGKNVVMNIFPSVDTGVCAASVRKFNAEASKLDNTVVLCISKDLPFAMKRFCGAEGLNNVVTLSDYRNKGFSKNYGVEITDGAFEALDARAVVIVGTDGKVKHTELVPEIGQEPNYEAAIKSL
ncbi:thiol peroxidase [Chryseotalea sanaruensis]|uniref:Thiol peroxidase n=1 Tax=Chryseotalea sanaruensis TaxID=2482724 RepID=A0A401U7S3_9BACT|nr:thiol peroxidase [Chryseotalea sanaruensis]GCC50940.1 thiol peroxidase [Chryseotalea sanaruensis]